jgi:hypothetical protein
MQSNFKFSDYIMEVAALIGQSTTVNAGALPECKASFIIDECPIEIFCAPTMSSRSVFRCRFGPAPSYSPLKAYVALLRFNFEHYVPGGGSTFGLDPATGEVAFYSELLLEMLTPQMTLDYMVSVAAMRRLWQEGRL